MAVNVTSRLDGFNTYNHVEFLDCMNALHTQWVHWVLGQVPGGLFMIRIGIPEVKIRKASACQRCFFICIEAH